MGICQHVYRDSHTPCPHLAPAGATTCIWHNPAVRKVDAYVHSLLIQADAAAQADLSEFTLAGLEWPKALLPLRKLRGVDLRDSFLDGADLSGSDLSSACLRRASLKQIDLRGAKLVGADLTGTNLAGADLRDADLTGAALAGTNLAGADLRGANLAGAKIIDFRWNRLTRFSGVKGLDPNRESSDSDPTQAFPAPLALEITRDDLSALTDLDPELTKTRVFAPVTPDLFDAAPAWPPPPVDALTPTPPAPAPAIVVRTGWWRAATAAGLVLAAGGLGVGAWGWNTARRAAATPGPTVDVAALLAQERINHDRQREADLAELKRVQAQSREGGDRLAAARQEAAVVRAESEALRASLHETEADVMRLRTADDRAILATLRVAELEKLNRELALSGSRQDQIGRILADGVGRLKTDNQTLASERDQLVIDHKRLADAESDGARIKTEANALRQERDALQTQNQRLTGNLLAASHDLERYLARLSTTQLHDYLGDAGEQAPPLALSPGKPIALSGDYLLTLRVDPGAQPSTVQVQVVVQRPAAAANPEVTVVLYDRDQRPLRRLSHSFPHIDAGKPFVAVSTTVACDRFPAFARVLIAPGMDGLSAAR